VSLKHRHGPVAIVGTGALGTALAHAFVASGVAVRAIASRDPDRAAAAASAFPGAIGVSLDRVAKEAPVVLLAVADSAIESVASALAGARGVIVAHTSGSRDTKPLAAVRAHGARVGAFHPLAAVVKPAGPVDAGHWTTLFRGAAFAIEGSDGDVTAQLTQLATALGGKPFTATAAAKARYHLGASMLAAFSAGLAQVAWEGMRAAGAPADVASAGVGHLLETVARNVAAAPAPAAALTGPVARGDAGGVTRQAIAAEVLPREAQVLYRAHAEHNIQLAQHAGRITKETADALVAALHAHGNSSS